MSGIFGVFNRNGEPVSAVILQGMEEAMSYWEPDDSNLWQEGPVGLGHTMLWNTPESKLEQLPGKRGPLVITMDARLDNRKELVQKLGMVDPTLGEITDSDLILAAYGKWKDDCPKHLLGDFAFAIWDKEEQKLFCARDQIGIKPLYYHLSDELFVFGNEMQCFICHPNIDMPINDQSIAYYLRGEEDYHNNTFFQGIYKLPPATSITITAITVEKNTYWLPEDSPLIQLESIEAYVSKLKELLSMAVRDRLRSAYPITSHLSGGLDSSGISAIAARILKKENKRLLAFNWISGPTENDNPDYYEWNYSKLLADLEDISHHYIYLNERDLEKIFLEINIANNDTVDLWYEFLVRDATKEEHSRVILSGWGGDELVTSYGRGYFQELILSGKWLKAFTELKRYRAPKRYSFMVFSRLCFSLFVWQKLPRNLRSALRKPNFDESLSLCCMKDVFLEYTKHTPRIDPQVSTASVRDVQLSYLIDGHLQTRVESWAASSARNKLEYRYPLLDKRLIEFILGIPAELFFHGSTTRYIYREAMKGILPDKIRLNSEKDEPKRIQEFHEITLKGLLFAMKSLENKQSDHIDPTLLTQKILDTDLSWYNSRDERISVLESFVRALLVLNIRDI